MFWKVWWNLAHERKRNTFCNSPCISGLQVILETRVTKQKMSRCHQFSQFLMINYCGVRKVIYEGSTKFWIFQIWLFIDIYKVYVICVNYFFLKGEPLPLIMGYIKVPSESEDLFAFVVLSFMDTWRLNCSPALVPHLMMPLLPIRVFLSVCVDGKILILTTPRAPCHQNGSWRAL